MEISQQSMIWTLLVRTHSTLKLLKRFVLDMAVESMHILSVYISATCDVCMFITYNRYRIMTICQNGVLYCCIFVYLDKIFESHKKTKSKSFVEIMNKLVLNWCTVVVYGNV